MNIFILVIKTTDRAVFQAMKCHQHTSENVILNSDVFFALSVALHLQSVKTAWAVSAKRDVAGRRNLC